jgi:hypothetical protein
LATLILTVPLRSQAHLGVYAAETPRRPLVCTLPLPGFGLWQPAGSHAPRCAALLTACSRSPQSKGVSDVTQPKLCDVALVCTLPLPGIGSWQPAGSVASRCAGDSHTPERPTQLSATGSILTGPSWFNYSGEAISGFAYPRGSAFDPGPSRCSHSRDTATYLWSARYPCQVTVSDSPSGLTRSRSAGSIASRCGQAPGAPDVAELRPHSTFLVQLRRGALA